MNDEIDPESCSLLYVSVDQVAEVAAQLGTGAHMAKIDIESSYWLIPVHPHDCPLQAVQWKGKVYIDALLPFGLRSDPNYSMRWPMSGVCERKVFRSSSTTWTTSLC